MKKMNFRILTSFIMALAVVFVTSCDEDDPAPVANTSKPVLNENFTYTVDVNTIKFTTDLTGNVWVTKKSSGVETAFVDGKCDVFVAQKGEHVFTVSMLKDGATVASDEFTVTIAEDDLSFLNEGLWLYLSGGEGKSKTWKMDINAEGKCAFFEGPMYYSGYEAGGVRYPYWAWDVLPEQLPYTIEGTSVAQTGFFNWSPDYAGNTWIMAANDYGTITFNGNDMTAKTSKFGVDASGSFTFNPETWKLTLAGVTLPIDTARVNEPEYLELGNLRIFTLTDSSMQIGIKRTYEGKNDDGTQKVSEWTNVYNFICADYTYAPEEFTYTESVKTSFAKADLVGTWKYADVPQGWIAYNAHGNKGTEIPAHMFGLWDSRSDITAETWMPANTDSTFTANDANRYVFNNDGTCTLNGIANTYTVANGIITFGTALTTEFSQIWITMTGTELKAIDFAYYGDGAAMTEYPGAEGIWIGQQNGTKQEYQAVQLVKVTK